MRKLLTCLLFVFAISFVISTKTEAFSGSGGGVDGNPYVITSCAQFEEMNASKAAVYSLANDLDCSSRGNNVMIGTFASMFTGKLNGNGHTINVNLNNTSNGTALFVAVSAATISDVRITGTIYGGSYTAGLIGYSTGATKIDRVANAANIYCQVNSALAFGGIVAFTDSDSSVVISDSYNEGNILLKPGSNISCSTAGGIAGWIFDATIRRIYNRGAIKLTSANGGIVGSGLASPVITDSFNVGAIVQGSLNVIGGALAGNIPSSGYGPFSHQGTITNNYVDRSRSGLAYCWGYSNSYNSVSETWPGECDRVNATWDQNDYFKGNSTAHPFVNASSITKWDFTNVWETVTNGYPALRSLIGDEHAVTNDNIVAIPGAPVNIHTLVVDERRIQLNWDNNGNQYVPTKYYFVEYKKVEEDTWKVIDTRKLTIIDFDSPVIDVLALDKGTDYELRIKAVNDLGESDYSSVFNFTTLGTPIAASAPSNLAVTPQSDPLVVDLTWTAPSSAGDYATTKYIVEAKLSSSTWDDVALYAATADTTTSLSGFSGFQNGKTYNIRVSAYNPTAGQGTPSQSVNYTTPAITTHTIRNCSTSADESSFGLQAVDDDSSFATHKFVLANNIDCNGVSFSPLTFPAGFQGELDGQSFTISNLSITSGNTNRGLFSEIKNAYIHNLSLNVTFSNAGTRMSDVGAIAGLGTGYLKLSNINATVTYLNQLGDNHGGLLGEYYGEAQNDSLTIQNSHVVMNTSNAANDNYGNYAGILGTAYCGTNVKKNCTVLTGNTVEGTMSAGSYGTGGIVGFIYVQVAKGVLVSGNTFNGTITASTAPGSTGVEVGGIMGDLIYYSKGLYIVTNNTTSGQMNGLNYMLGGILGYVGNRSAGGGLVFSGNNSSMNITGEETIGGLIGSLENNITIISAYPDSISSSSYTGNITGASDGYDVGGLIGVTDGLDIEVRKSFFNGNLVGGDYVGGIIGDANGSGRIEDVYSTGNITGTNSVGGIFGYTYGQDYSNLLNLANSYSASNITSDTLAGGIVAELDDNVSISNSFFDGTLTASGDTSQVGAVVGTSYGDVYAFDNIYYNDAKVNSLPCAADPSNAADFTLCHAVNVGNGNPNYFIGNLENEPISGWNISTVWKLVANEHPQFRWFTQDSTAPVLTLLGSSAVKVKKGHTYTDAGATAIDDLEGNLTSKIVVTNPVNVNVVGTYYVLYNVCDSDHNCAATLSRRVDVYVPVTQTTPISTTTNGGTSTPSSPQVSNEIRLDNNQNYIVGQNVSVNANESDIILVPVNNVNYSLKLKEIGDNYIVVYDEKGNKNTIEIGQSSEIDVNNDGSKDVQVIVSDINDSADLIFKAVLGQSIQNGNNNEETPNNSGKSTDSKTEKSTQRFSNYVIYSFFGLLIVIIIFLIIKKLTSDEKNN